MSSGNPDLSAVRNQFPALQQTDAAGRPYVYLDGPGGTQVPQIVLDAMRDYMVKYNCNTHATYITSDMTVRIIEETRQAMADFFNARRPEEICFGANMTTLTFNISRALGHRFTYGDEIILTRLDHDANVSPWMALAEKGLKIKFLDIHPEDCTLALEQLPDLLTPRTRLIAVGYASNAVGTINPIPEIVRLAHQNNTLVYVDAVHYAPHRPIDVQAIDCDFLVCSAYKFFGPHIGVLYGKYPLLDKITSYKVRPAEDRPPHKFETGTQNHEGIAGCGAAVSYLAELGRRFALATDDQTGAYEGRRRELKQAMAAIGRYESSLAERLISGLESIRGVKIYGITDRGNFANRVPTVSIRHDRLSPQEMEKRLGQLSIFLWEGNFYAWEITRRLGIEEAGGLLRIGIAHYNTAQEIDRLLQEIEKFNVS